MSTNYNKNMYKRKEKMFPRLLGKQSGTFSHKYTDRDRGKEICRMRKCKKRMPEN